MSRFYLYYRTFCFRLSYIEQGYDTMERYRRSLWSKEDAEEDSHIAHHKTCFIPCRFVRHQLQSEYPAIYWVTLKVAWIFMKWSIFNGERSVLRGLTFITIGKDWFKSRGVSKKVWSLKGVDGKISTSIKGSMENILTSHKDIDR